MSYKGATVRDGLYLSFTFSPEDWPKIKHHVKKQCTGGSRAIPFHERWSSRHFTLDKIFNIDIIPVDKKIEVEQYYDLSSWSNLKQYYASDLRISRPTKQFMKPYHHRRTIYDEKN